MKKYKKKDFPVDKVRRFLEPGPVVLVSSAYKGERDIITMGWHMIMMDEPSLVGCFIWDQNYSHELVRRSKECVINVPTVTSRRRSSASGIITGRSRISLRSLG